MPFIAEKRTVYFKKETTPYTAETLTATDGLRVVNGSVSYTPEFEIMARKYATGDHDVFSGIVGKKRITVSFSMHKSPSASGGTTAPEWAEVEQCCGKKQTEVASGIKWEPHADYDAIPATIWVQEVEPDGTDGMLIKVRGAMGNPSHTMNELGEVIQTDYEFQGVFNGIADTADPFTPSGFDASNPSAVIGTTIAAFSDALPINSFTINENNQISLYKDPSDPEGFYGAYITSRGDGPSVTLDPYMDLLATRNQYSRWSGGTTGTLNIQAGSGATKITLYAGAMQIMSAYGSSDRDGFSSHTIEGVLTKVGAGNDCFKILQGSE
jgi:hypothetical protein